MSLLIVWFPFALNAGAIELSSLPFLALFAVVLTFVLIYEFRFQGKVVSIIDILYLLGGWWITARDDLEDLRCRLAECESRISELTDSDWTR